MLTVDHPPHGFWAPGATEVEIRGTARPGTAALSKLEVSGVEVPIGADGSFGTLLPLSGSADIFGLRLEDVDGGRAVDARAVLSGGEHASGALIPDAIYLALRDDFLDDNEPDLDDLAGIVEHMLEDPTTTAGLDLPYEAGLATVRPMAVRIPVARADIEPLRDALRLRLVLEQAEVDFEMEGSPGFESLSTTGSFHAREVTLLLRLVLSVDGGSVVAEVADVDATIEGFTMTTVRYADLLDAAPSLVDSVAGMLEQRIEEEVSTRAGDLIAGYVQAMAFDFALDQLGLSLSIHMELSRLQVSERGVLIVLAASAWSPAAPGVPNADTLMSLRTVSTPPLEGFGLAPIAAAVDDDLLNQVFLAHFAGGGMTRLALTEEDMGEGAEELPDVFKPLYNVELNATLPSVVLKRPNDGGLPFELVLGDLGVTLRTGDGRTFDLLLSIRAGLRLFADENPLLRLDLEHRPRHLEVHVHCTEAPGGVDPGSVAALIRLMIPPALRHFNKDQPGLPIPAAPIGSLLSVESLKDHRLVMTSMEVRNDGAEGHFLVFEGHGVLQPGGMIQPQ